MQEEESKDNSRAQRADRNRRLRERNRRRLDFDSEEEPDDYIIDDVIEQEESEISEDSLMRDVSKKKAVIRNHNFYSNRVQEDDVTSEEVSPERKATSKSKSNQYAGMFSSNRVIVEEEKEKVGAIKSFSTFLSRNNTENYVFERKLTSDGYHIDVDEAVEMRDQDKTVLDCALCKKKKGEFSLIGPFKYYIKDKVTDEMVYWFHRECLERNDIVKQVNRYEFAHIHD